jgi:hypothetical protein
MLRRGHVAQGARLAHSQSRPRRLLQFLAVARSFDSPRRLPYATPREQHRRATVVLSALGSTSRLFRPATAASGSRLSMKSLGTSTSRASSSLRSTTIAMTACCSRSSTRRCTSSTRCPSRVRASAPMPIRLAIRFACTARPRTNSGTSERSSRATRAVYPRPPLAPCLALRFHNQTSDSNNLAATWGGLVLRSHSECAAAAFCISVLPSVRLMASASAVWALSPR